MRRSNSLLNNLAHQPQAQQGGYQPYPQQQQVYGNQADMAAQPYPDQAFYQGQAYPQATVYPPQMQQPPVQHPSMPMQPPLQPVQMQTAPLQQAPAYPDPTAGYAYQDLQTAQANLEGLIGRLSQIAASQENGLRNSSQEQLGMNDQLQRLSNAVAQLQSGVAELQRKPGAQDTVPEIRNLIDGLHKKISDSLPESQINPAAYAKVVEASHAEVLNEVKNIHSVVAQANHDEHSLTEVLGSHRDEVVQRLEMLSGRLTEMDRTEDRAELFALRQQIENLEHSIREGNPNPDGELDQETINERLEEMTRAILALSGTENGIDNLERLEARMIDLSRNLSSGGAPQELESFFDETRDALGALGQRLDDLSHSGIGQGSDDALLNQVKQLSDRVADLSVTGIAAESEGNSAFLQRLDDVADRLENLHQQSGETGDDDERYQKLMRKLTSISSQLQGVTRVSGEGEEAAGKFVAVENPHLDNRLDEIINGLDTLEKRANNTETESLDLQKSLMDQLRDISDRLDNATPGDLALEPIEKRLDSIEQQLGASRDIGIEMASSAAEDAVRKVMGDMPAMTGPDSDVLNGLWDDIRKLNEAHAAEAGNADEDVTYVKKTLDQIAGRLGALEQNLKVMRDEARQAPPVVQPAPVVAAMPASPAVPETAALAQAPEPMVAQPQPREMPQAPAQTGAAFGIENPAPEMPELVPMEAGFVNEHEPEVPMQDDPVGVVGKYGSPSSPEQYQQAAAASVHNNESSAGDHLVRAAREAEIERQRAKQGAEERFASEGQAPLTNEFDADLPNTVPSPVPAEAVELPHVEAPQLAHDGMDFGIPNEPVTPVAQIDQSGQPSEGQDVPIAPGASGPDLASLVRQANERRKQLVESGEESSGTDFLAAARRAAQAAAKEASESEAEAIEEEEKPGLVNRLTSMLSSGKSKTLVFAIIALVMVAIAVPIAAQFAFNSRGPSTFDEAVLEPSAGDANEAELDLGQTNVVLLETDEIEVSGTDDASGTDESGFTPELVTLAEEEAAPVEAFPFDTSELDAFPKPLREAALANEELAVFEVARRYTSGAGVERNLETASRYYSHAAEMGFVPAQYFIGNFYEKGIGVEIDRTIAQAWYEQAAYGGHIIAMHNLGVMFAASDPATGKADLTKAFEWFKKAGAYGIRDSQVNLGIFYAKGMAGEIDLVESYKWLALAARSGDEDALEKSELIADAMRPDQLEQAKQLVADWRELESDPAVNNVEIPESWKQGAGVAQLLSDSGSIALAQSLLGKAGFDAGPADGVMGKKTRTAIRNFRSRVGLPVTDKLDTEFMEALRAVVI